MSVGLPPITEAYYLFDQFNWCQVKFVFAHELQREQKGIGPDEAGEEADLVIEALQKGDKPLAFGAQPGELNWPVMICSANAYAHATTESRARIRQKLAGGQPIYAIFATLEDPDLCNPKVLEDPEYNPEPYCITKEAASAVAMAVTSMAWTLGLVFAFRGLSARL